MLTGKQKRFLRAQGHHLTAVVQIGKEGVTEALVEAVDAALTTHELVKLKVGQAAPVDRHEVAEQIAGETGADLVQVLGGAVLLYRRHPEDPKLELPT